MSSSLLEFLAGPSAAATAAPGATFGEDAGFSIESGYFIFTLMPSLFCKLRCPHCYLSLDQRQDRSIMSLDDLELTCHKIDSYYVKRGLARKTIVGYWYGGEPTSMGKDYVLQAGRRMAERFPAADGYSLRHTILTALLTVDDDWFPIFSELGQGEVQSSFDGRMRGITYLKRWEAKVRAAIRYGLRLSTISVVNRHLLEDGPEVVLDYLAGLGVAETSWLPFMWNDQNKGAVYDDLAPTMYAWSDFMIGLCEAWLRRREAGQFVPEIGQLRFILAQAERPHLANIAGQTLFLMPDGEFVLPDYKDGWQEFMQPFGNILRQDFEAVLTSPARRAYLRRQALRNRNPECLACDDGDKCVMEFWKDNRPDDDCFGGRRFVRWVLGNRARLDRALGTSRALLY